MLAALFVDTLIVSNLQIGSLMEQNFTGPIVTIEAGGTGNPESFNVAKEGLRRYFLKENVFDSPKKMYLFHNPLRLELDCKASMDYAPTPLKERDVTLRNDIESLNFQNIGTNELIGWIDSTHPTCLRVKSADCICKADEYFSIRQKGLYPKSPMTIFMATERADIASSDCLFYFVCHGSD